MRALNYLIILLGLSFSCSLHLRANTILPAPPYDNSTFTFGTLQL